MTSLRSSRSKRLFSAISSAVFSFFVSSSSDVFTSLSAPPFDAVDVAAVAAVASVAAVAAVAAAAAVAAVADAVAYAVADAVAAVAAACCSFSFLALAYSRQNAGNCGRFPVFNISRSFLT